MKEFDMIRYSKGRVYWSPTHGTVIFFRTKLDRRTRFPQNPTSISEQGGQSISAAHLTSLRPPIPALKLTDAAPRLSNPTPSLYRTLTLPVKNSKGQDHRSTHVPTKNPSWRCTTDIYVKHIPHRHYCRQGHYSKPLKPSLHHYIRFPSCREEMKIIK